jgi:hypothetical protein
MNSVATWALASTLVGGLGTLAIFSFLAKENRFYRFFEHLFIGIAAGLGPIVIIRDFFWPKVVEPMLGGNVTVYPDGTLSEPYQPLYLLYLVPMAFGCLYYFIYSRRYAWLAKVVIGFTLGLYATLSIRGFFSEVVPQLQGSFKPLVVKTGDTINLYESLNNCVFVVILLLVLNYFFFTFGKKEGALQAKVAPLGRPLLMVCFGAFFGSTVMARLALLVERVQFLLRDWVAAVGSLVGMV